MKKIILVALLCILITFASCQQPNESSDNSNEVSKIDNEWYDSDTRINITPGVKRLKSKRETKVIKAVSIVVDNTTNQVALNSLESFLAEKNIAVEENAQLSIYLGANNENAGEGEGYYINTAAEQILLCSTGDNGQYYAVNTFAQLWDDDALQMVEISDSPDFPIRGVVEGFYGTPWSWQDRLSIISFLGENRMNTYIYAPKDDKKLRDKWREPYTEQEQQQISDLLKCANNHSVSFVYAISPGQDFDFSNYEEEFNILIEKCNSVYELGVRDFALLLDDLPVRTAESARNHVRLVNDFREQFYENHTDLSELICIFAEYLDTMVTGGYTNTIANYINSDVIVMWTGASIDIHMSASDFDFANKKYNRKMLLWWNYPVNDYCENKLLADGVQGLSRDLNTAVQGIVSNPMNQAETSKVVLKTLSEYLWNSATYQYKTSYDAALKELFPNTNESVRMLLENLYGSGINNYVDSIRFKLLIEAFVNEYNTGKKDGSGAKLLYAEFENLKAAVIDIETNCENRAFVTEIENWLNKAKLTAEMGMHFLDAMSAESEADFWESFRQFSELKLIYDDNTAVFSQNVLTPFLNGDAVAILKEIGPKGVSVEQEITIERFVDIEENVVVSASLGCYQDNDITKAIDGDENTYYWSNWAATEGFWIMLDLGAKQNVFNIVMKSGVSPSGLDYIRLGQLQYSTDGINWFDIGEPQTMKDFALSSLDIECRYIRYISLSKQDYWMSVSDFSVNARVTGSKVEGKPFGKYGNEKIRMTDGNLFTFFESESPTVVGEKTTIDISNTDCSELLILLFNLCNADVYVSTNGEEKLLGSLDNYYNSFAFTEDIKPDRVILVWKEATTPKINEIVLR